jgi:hypothetical protein
MTSVRPSSVARCQFCGREFDSRGFQVFVAGMRGTFDSTECALRAADGETSPALARRDASEPARPQQLR